MFKSQIVDFFDRDSSSYAQTRWERDSVAKGDWSLRKALISRSLSALAPEQSKICIELGCGPGLWLSEISPFGVTLGLDFSVQMLRRARSNAPTAVLVCGDASRVPLADDSVDYILACHSIEYVKDISGICSEIRRIAKDGAIICLVTKNKKAIVWRLYKLATEMMRSNTQPPQFWRSPQDFEKRLPMRIIEICGIYPRVPLDASEVNHSFSPIRRKRSIGIHKLTTGILKWVTWPFCWHFGMIAQIEKPKLRISSICDLTTMRA